MNIKIFFTLGFLPQYLMFGIPLAILFAIYVFFKTRRIFKFFKKDPNAAIPLLIRILLALLIVPFCINVWSPAAAVAFYIIVTSVFIDIIFAILHLFLKKKFNIFNKFYIHTICVAIVFCVIFCFSYYNMNNVVNTSYDVENNKTNDSLKICFISDIHFGTVQPTDRLAEKIEEINSQNYDAVILGGDITDERTTKQDMEYCYSLLGNLKSTYGTYFIYGNHDLQPYTTDYVNGCRTYTDEELQENITKNGIHILQDSAVTINNIVFVGRDDVGWGSDIQRKSFKDILNDTDTSKFIVNIDHKPADQEEVEGEGCTLQLSGHTHCGQIWPFNLYLILTGNCSYGAYDINGLTNIVSSGFAGWGYPVRNTAVCEYLTINIH